MVASVQDGSGSAAVPTPKPLPIAPTGKEVSGKFPVATGAIQRALSGPKTNPPVPARTAQSLQKAALRSVELSRRGETLSVIA